MQRRADGQRRQQWGRAYVWMLAWVLGACTSDPAAPWNQPPYGTAYCENCSTVEGALGQAEYPPAAWVESPNFTPANRGTGDITVVVMHTVQGSYAGCISWFKNPQSKVSAHYVISKSGAVTQMVKEKDIGWHVASQNGYTIGIEHEGYVDDPAWVTPKMLDASAQLTCYLLKKYQLSASNSSIKGHVQLPKQTHTDPGVHWPYADYLAKVQACIGGTPPPPAPCAGGCDDGKACTDDSCQNGACVHTANTGAVCWDGDACTAGEKCDKGVCSGGKIVKDCNDGNPCTNDGCSGGNCTHTANGGACDDGNPCTAGDQCSGGACKGKGTGCDDSNPCTVDTCVGNACAHTAKSGPCDDGDGCTVGDQCAGGKCQAGAAKTCIDANPCTSDGCSGGGCVFAATAGGPCDDGDPCSIGDYCAQGQCLGGMPLDCDDNAPCTVDSCVNGACQHAGGIDTPPTCQGTDRLVADPCGGPPVVQPCPSGQVCVAGVCAATSDAGGSDVNASIDSDGGTADGGVAKARPAAPVDGGCGTGVGGQGGWTRLWPLVLVAGVVRRRRQGATR